MAENQYVWIQPTLIAELEYRAWTHDRKLRHPSYKGLREEQDEPAINQLMDFAPDGSEL